MNFVLGYIAGTTIAILIIAVLTYFRASIEYRIKVIEKQIENAGPRPKGAIFMPEDDSDISRRQLIEKNRKLGKDTPFEELR